MSASSQFVCNSTGRNTELGLAKHSTETLETHSLQCSFTVTQIPPGAMLSIKLSSNTVVTLGVGTRTCQLVKEGETTLEVAEGTFLPCVIHY